MIRADSSFQTACTLRPTSTVDALLTGAEDLLDHACSIADDAAEPAGQLDRLLLGGHLDQGEAGHRLLRLGEGSVDHGDFAVGRDDAGAAGLEASGGEQGSGRRRLLDELGHLGVQRLVGFAAVSQRHHQVPHGWSSHFRRSWIESLTQSSNSVCDRERPCSLSRLMAPFARVVGVRRVTMTWTTGPLTRKATTMTYKVGYFVGS